MQRVVAVRSLEPYKVWLRFSDHSEGVVDLGEVFARGGVFAPLRDPEEFRKVRLVRAWGTIEWPEVRAEDLRWSRRIAPKEVHGASWHALRVRWRDPRTLMMIAAREL